MLTPPLAAHPPHSSTTETGANQNPFLLIGVLPHLLSIQSWIIYTN